MNTIDIPAFWWFLAALGAIFFVLFLIYLYDVCPAIKSSFHPKPSPPQPHPEPEEEPAEEPAKAVAAPAPAPEAAAIEPSKVASAPAPASEAAAAEPAKVASAPARTPEAAAAEPAKVASAPASASEAAAAEPTAEDDLKKIEGIGPKIEATLKSYGIRTFADLAQKSPAELQALLDEAGYARISNPETWAEQAALAAEGKWEALAELQASLKGGRRIA